ncbi:MAG: GFA family protein [Armatimonadetes bacterium]|nr:GFA family protein [Armatimonadota bacterium]
MTRRASCCCGQLQVTCEGDPVRVGMCHCFACQRRTGSVFGAQARFPRERVRIQGQTGKYVRVGDSGGSVDFYFCPVCASTVYWENQGMEGLVAIAVGCFADPGFPAPSYSVYEVRSHSWARSCTAGVLEHYD